MQYRAFVSCSVRCRAEVSIEATSLEDLKEKLAALVEDEGDAGELEFEPIWESTEDYSIDRCYDADGEPVPLV